MPTVTINEYISATNEVSNEFVEHAVLLPPFLVVTPAGAAVEPSGARSNVQFWLFG